jgi:hypothetical protein
MLSFNPNGIRHKIGWLNLAAELGNVTKACKVMGLSRDTFYRYRQAQSEGGVEALLEANRRKPNLKNRVDAGTEEAVLAYAFEQAAHGQVRASNELRKRGVFVSPSGVRSIWLRHGLASFKQRLSALEKQVTQQGIVLTGAQVAALEKKHEDDLASARSRRHIRAIWVRRIRSTWARSRGSGVSTSKRSSIPTAKWPLPSSTRPRRRLPPPIC